MILMDPFNVVSITHSDDFDGIGSQAIIYRYFSILHNRIPDNCGQFSDSNVNLILFQTDYQDYLYYWAAMITGFKQKLSEIKINFIQEWKSTYLQLHNVTNTKDLELKYGKISKEAESHIQENLDLWSKTDLIIVTDIGYNKAFVSLYPLLKEFNVPLLYFDHHYHPQKSKKFFKKYCIRQKIKPSSCATQIVQKFFLPRDPISKSIANLGVDTDYGKYSISNSQEIMSLISYFRKNYEELNRIVRKYAEGTFFDEDLNKKYESIEQWENKQVESLLQSLQYYTLPSLKGNSVKVIVGHSQLRSGRSMNHLEIAYSQNQLIPQVTKNHKVILLTLDQQSLNTNIKSEKINVHKIAEHFGGGGHINRAGFRFPAKFIKKPWLSDYKLEDLNLKEFLQEFVPFL